MENKVFNELSLREDIKKQWGEHGAHMDLYNRILKTHYSFLDEKQVMEYEIQSAGLLKMILMFIFPGIFARIIFKKHKRYLQMRYPNE